MIFVNLWHLRKQVFYHSFLSFYQSVHNSHKFLDFEQREVGLS